jgi:hypothetical protein
MKYIDTELKSYITVDIPHNTKGEKNATISTKSVYMGV